MRIFAAKNGLRSYLSIMLKQNKKLILFVLLILAAAVLRFSMLGEILTFQNVQRYRDEFQIAVAGHYLLSVIVYIAAYIVIAGLSIPGAALYSMIGGFIYGTVPAAVYVNIGATVGATLAFLVARYLVGDWLQRKYRDQLARFNRDLHRNAASYLLGLRLAPLFPFFLINILSGFTKIPLRTFVWTTALGIIPGSLVYTYAGRQLGSINASSDIFSTHVIIAFFVLALLALIPALVNRSRTSPRG